MVPHLLRTTASELQDIFISESYQISHGICPGFHSGLRKKQFDKRAVVRRAKLFSASTVWNLASSVKICYINNNASNIRMMVISNRQQI